MKAQKMRSKIIKIKGTSGVWIDEASQIQQIFVQDFSSRFKSQRTNSAPLNIALPRTVSEEDNYLLLRPV